MLFIRHGDVYGLYTYSYTVCPGSSNPPEKSIFASENEVYTIY